MDGTSAQKRHRTFYQKNTGNGKLTLRVGFLFQKCCTAQVRDPLFCLLEVPMIVVKISLTPTRVVVLSQEAYQNAISEEVSQNICPLQESSMNESCRTRDIRIFWFWHCFQTLLPTFPVKTPHHGSNQIIRSDMKVWKIKIIQLLAKGILSAPWFSTLLKELLFLVDM